MNDHGISLPWLFSLVLAAFSHPAQAALNIVTNGDFETTTNRVGQSSYNTAAPGWTTANPPPNADYSFIFAPGAGGGATSVFGNLKLWSPIDGSANGLPAESPTGGNFLAGDGAFQASAVQQRVPGLTPGQNCNFSFCYAVAQQTGFCGPTAESWQASLGSLTQTTAVLANASEGFIVRRNASMALGSIALLIAARRRISGDTGRRERARFKKFCDTPQPPWKPFRAASRAGFVDKPRIKTVLCVLSAAFRSLKLVKIFTLLGKRSRTISASPCLLLRIAQAGARNFQSVTAT